MMDGWSSGQMAEGMQLMEEAVGSESMVGPASIGPVIESIIEEIFSPPNVTLHYTHCSEPIGECEYGY